MLNTIVAQAQRKVGIAVNDLDQRKVAEHNELIASTARMGLVPLKLFEIAVSAVNSSGKAADNQTVTISKDAIYQLLGVTNARRGQHLDQALRELRQNADFELTKTKGKRVTKIGINPISSTVYNSDEPYVTITFTDQVMPYITELKRDFTQYQLVDVTKLNSKHAVSLYKVLIAYYNQYEYYLQKGERNPEQLKALQNPSIDIKNLRRLTNAEDKYPQFSAYDRGLLSRAIKEISAKTILSITYDKIRVGRRVGKIRFHLQRKGEQAKLTTKQPSAPVDVTAVVTNRYGGLLVANSLLDGAELQADSNLQRAIVTRLFPAYDRFVKAHDFATLQKHVAYVGTHTNGTPTNLVPYMLEALDKYEAQLAKADQQASRQRKGKVTEKLPEWAEKTDAGERTEGPASEAQVQDSLDKLAEFRKSRHHE